MRRSEPSTVEPSTAEHWKAEPWKAEPWTAELAQRLGDATLTAELASMPPAQVIALVQRFGFAIIRSSPSGTDPSSIAERSAELLQFGRSLGTPVMQSPRNELVEDVKDYSDIEDTDDRGYRSGGELLPHSDPPTLILLHAVTPAKAGGETSLVSVAAIVERMNRTELALVDELFGAFPAWQVAGQYGRADAGPDEESKPVLARRDGVLSCVLYRPFIERAAAALNQPLRDQQVAALDRFERESTSTELTVRFVLQPGETVALHNRAVLHARTDYVDHEALDRRRHLLRMWIDAPSAFPVDPAHELGDFFATPT